MQVYCLRQRKEAYLTLFLKEKYSCKHRETRLVFMKTGGVVLDVTNFQPDLLLRNFSCSAVAGSLLGPRISKNETFTWPQQLENSSMSPWCRSGPPWNICHVPKGSLCSLRFLYRKRSVPRVAMQLWNENHTAGSFLRHRELELIRIRDVIWKSIFLTSSPR